jgi:two-component system NtrC family sensor kinase
MIKIPRLIKDLYSGPFQAPLVFAFTAVAAITIGVGAWVISATINSYLVTEMNERVARDIRLAETFYDQLLLEISQVADRLSTSPTIDNNIKAACMGDSFALKSVSEEILREASIAAFGRNLFTAVLDANGIIVSGYFLSAVGDASLVSGGGDWAMLPIIQDALVNGQAVSSTEILPVEYLETVNLDKLAHIELIDTPKAAVQPFDLREGSAGLALVAVKPIMDQDKRVVGMILSFHLLNNGFTLVDQIRAAAGIDTVTIFLGDLRVSTNVMTAENQRAVGTRLAEEVSNVVLGQGKPYVGPAFVVNENYITRYEPLRDGRGQIVGAIYVGARQSAFQRLLNTVDQRISLIATLTILLTFILATPVSRAITRPLKELRQLARTSRRVAEGDLTARAPVFSKGEVGQLAADFNYMLDTLQATKDQLVHSENLAAIGQLAAGVAHELNNPLGTVLLYADTLLRESNEQDQRHSDLKVIVREVQRCKSIVAALLDFARQRQSTVQDVDLNELVLSILEVEKIHPRYQAMRFIVDLDPNLPRIQADPTQLREVFINLMTNAAEAMPGGGQLTLQTIADPPEMVTIVVSDTGMGISKENLGKIFTPFFTTKPIGKGTGLGLAITYGIVKLHRGQINVKSHVGEGTTFTISLPRRSSGFSGNTTDQTGRPGKSHLIGEQDHQDEHTK